MSWSHVLSSEFISLLSQVSRVDIKSTPKIVSEVGFDEPLTV
jgi:hypothetical protein